MPRLSYPNFAPLLETHLARQDRNVTWLANALKLNVSTVSRWLNEDARPGKADIVLKIIKALQIKDKEEQKALFQAAGYELLIATEIPVATPNVIVPRDDKVPYMTPALPVHGVIGRDSFLGNIGKEIRVEDMGAREVQPLALVGMGGIGKTTLTVAFGRQSRIPTWFPDGVLWVMLGQEPVIRLLLEGWGKVLGLDLLAERDEQACVERLRAALYHRQMLLLVDDVWNVEDGKHFLVGGPACRTIVTTREKPVARTLVTSARMLRVDLLEPQYSLQLLHTLAPLAVAMDPKGANEVCERLEHLPLALTLAGRFLANEEDMPARMQRLLRELVERREQALNLIVENDETKPLISLRAILGLSVERLSQTDKERFAMTSVFGGDPLTWDTEAAAAVWECSEAQAEETISHFIQRSLVEPRGENRFWMHALLADYADAMCEEMGL